jgi:hypothetical protein
VDHCRTFATLLIAFAGLGVGLGAGLPSPAIREAAWTEPNARLAALTSEPVECLTLPTDRGERDLVALGRHLFRTPLLLGGQAARAGLSCASCHRNGRGNADFLFPGLAVEPGTADVTSSFMSHSRGDGQFNPKIIPDLGHDTPKISRDPANRMLEEFLLGLVAQEFDGAPPSQRTLSALAAYVRAVQPSACAGSAQRPINLSTQLGEIVLGLSVAQKEAGRDDVSDLRLIIGGIRDRLGVIGARYVQRPKPLADLSRADRALAKIQDLTDSDPGAVPEALDQWQSQFARLAKSLTREEARSWFNPAVLAKSL